MSNRGVPVRTVEELTPRGVYLTNDPKYKFVRIIKHENVIRIRYYLNEWDAIYGDWDTESGVPETMTAWYIFYINDKTSTKLAEMDLRRLNDDVEDIPL
jgi:hypothetical protein